MKRIGVLTSGGDAPGMNAAVRAVVRTALDNDMSVIGFKHGYNGVLMLDKDQSENFELLTARSVSGRIHRGGTFLNTARCSSFHQPETRAIAIENMRSLGVEGLICIGGNGTFAGANALFEEGFPTIGIPGTIDNDLQYTDMTIGFDTAVNTACELVNHIRDTSDAHDRASLVTVMGRDCGEIALYTALACGAEYVMVPEIPWTIEEVADRVRWGVMRGKRSMIMIMAEGAGKSLQTDVTALCAKYEALSDLSMRHVSSWEIVMMIEALARHETRATVLGYTQRGGSPTAQDRVLASRFGAEATTLLRDNIGGRAVGIRENRLIDVPLAQARIGRTAPNQVIYDLIQSLT